MMRTFRMLLCVGIIFSTLEANAQVRRIGILKARVENNSVSNGEFIEIDYRNPIEAHYKIYGLNNKLKSEGYLNRKKYNVSYLPKDTMLFKKHEPIESGVRVLYSPIIYFNPKYAFEDTTDLMKYDLTHLLHDSIEIHYDQKNSDTSRIRIYKRIDGYYYPVSIGRSTVYDDKGILNSTYYSVELSKDIFFIKQVFWIDSKPSEEDMEILNPYIGALSEYRFDYNNEGKINYGVMSIRDSVYRYMNDSLYKVNNIH